MKTTLSLLCVGLLLPSAALAAPVTVAIRGVASGKGQIYASLCTRAEFLQKCALQQATPAKRGGVILKFPRVQPGHYALMVYHDENRNRTLDRGLFGIPTEGTGFGRDAVGRRGPPKFEDAVQHVPASGFATQLKLRY